MKNIVSLFGVFLWLAILTSCDSHISASKSKLMKFNYGGYSDTIYALISGQIYSDLEQKQPLDSVEICSSRLEPKDTITYTDSLGHFLTGFCSGTFTVRIKKKGFQTIKLINFESDPDQISNLEAIMQKGEGEVIYDISKRKINK